MKTVLSRLEPSEQLQLLDDLNYLNLAEVQSLCRAHGIPYRILVETPTGGSRVGPDTDRKPIVLERVRHWLASGEVLPATRLPASIVRDHPPPDDLGSSDRIYYRWYSKTFPWVMTALKELTGGRFENGALARVLIMEHWRTGAAPSLAQFANAWIEASDEPRDLLSGEYAYLTDLRSGTAGANWKTMRRSRARRALATIEGALAGASPIGHLEG